MLGVTKSEGHSNDSNSKQKTRVTVTKKLMMDNPFVVHISPEKPNIYLAVVWATTIDKIAELLSVGLHNQGKDYPKILIFCRSFWSSFTSWLVTAHCFEFSTLNGHNVSLHTGRVNLPDPEVLPDHSSNKPIPFVFVGDEAFPLKPYLMHPFPGRQLDSEEKKIFNYRLSRARRVIENTFGKLSHSFLHIFVIMVIQIHFSTGILSHRWRLPFTKIVAEPPKVVILVKAMCLLHDYLRIQETSNTHLLVLLIW